MTQTAELACTYAALILHDDGQDITGDKISKLINAAGVKVDAYWPKLFAKALEGQNVSSFFNFGGSSEGPAQPAVVAAKVVEAPKVEAKKEQPKKKKQQPKVEQEQDGGMGGLFD